MTIAAVVAFGIVASVFMVSGDPGVRFVGTFRISLSSTFSVFVVVAVGLVFLFVSLTSGLSSGGCQEPKIAFTM